MGKEIERKWLVDNFSNVPSYFNYFLFFEIDQGYLKVSNPENDEVRVRKKDGKYFLTIKKGGGLEREESEVEIPAETYDNLFGLSNCDKIEKMRYEIPEKNKIEFDVYKGNLEGLLIAEVEFENIEESKSYVPPKWFGKEVTDDKRYKNKNLAIYGIPKD